MICTCGKPAEFITRDISWSTPICGSCVRFYDGYRASNANNSQFFDYTIEESGADLLITERVSRHHYGHVEPSHTNVYRYEPTGY